MGTGLSGQILLLIAAIILRTSGAALRVRSRWPPVHSIGWILCAAAAWMIAGAAGAWFPLWPVVALGIIGAFVDVGWNHRQLWLAGDIVIVTLCGIFSTPPVAYGLLAGAAGVAAAVGFGADLVLLRSPRRVQNTVLSVPPGAVIVLIVMITLVNPGKVFREIKMPIKYHGILWNMFPHIGVTRVHNGDRIVLETGAVAWLDRPAARGTFPGALFFHGAHRNGSKQRAAVVARRALVDAGFIVLAVDHPGFGESPTPSLDAEVVAWDPLPTAFAAVTALRSMPDVDRIFAVGHSLGSTDVFRLLAASGDLDGAVLLGARLGDDSADSTDSAERSDYWYKRFHTDRGMGRWLSPERVHEISGRFYDHIPYVHTLSPEHAPILFVRFEFEWPDVAATRNALYHLIPGRKMVWDLAGSTHYFSSYNLAGVIIGDTRVTRSFASRLRLLASEPLLASKSPDPIKGGAVGREVPGRSF